MNLDHLAAQANKDLIEAPNEARIHAIASDIWIPYGTASRLLQRFEDLLQKPRQLRPENILVVAPSRNGKSALLSNFYKSHRADENGAGECSNVPVLWIENPARPDENRLYIEILQRLNQPHRINALIPEKEGLARQALQRVGTKIIVIDELHDALNGSDTRIAEYLRVLKKIGNVLKIHIIAAGTEGAERPLRKDTQLDNRFQKFPLPQWKIDREFLSYLHARVAFLPLKQPSNLKDVPLQQRLLQRGGRMIGGQRPAGSRHLRNQDREKADRPGSHRSERLPGDQRTNDYAFTKLRPAAKKTAPKEK